MKYRLHYIKYAMVLYHTSLVGIAVLAYFTATVEAAPPRAIVMMLGDDYGYHNVGFAHGPSPGNPEMRFVSQYPAALVCDQTTSTDTMGSYDVGHHIWMHSPSRASFWIGITSTSAFMLITHYPAGVEMPTGKGQKQSP